MKASTEFSQENDSSNSSSYSSDEEPVQKTAVIELQWDPNEENILVSFTDASICLVSFSGLDPKTCVKQRFNKQSSVMSHMFWASDKSGNFVTASDKFGVLTVWNVAVAEPRKIIKVGAAGVRSML